MQNNMRLGYEEYGVALGSFAVQSNTQLPLIPLSRLALKYNILVNKFIY